MSKMESPYVIFVGGLFRDLVACSERFPKVGETITGSKFHMGFGGKAANAAVMCARMGAKVALIGKLGNDDNGKAYREALDKEAIDTSFVLTDPQEPSGFLFSSFVTLFLKKHFKRELPNITECSKIINKYSKRF